MSRSSGTPVAGAREEAPGAPAPFTTDARRRLQLALAALWLLDALLQVQPVMFTPSFATEMLAPTATGNPGWIAASILWASRLVEHAPALLNAGFAGLQLAIGLGIAWRRSVRPALAVSVVWSLLVWWFGEGLGGLLTGGRDAMAGAPGAVLLYAVLAVLLWPTAKSTAGSFVAAQPVGPVAARVVWVVLWGGLVLLSHATPLGIAGSVVLAIVAIAVFLPPALMRVGIVIALVASAWIWVVGQSFGAVFSGDATDPNSGPLLALIALAYWPSRGES
ncbi:hypothetical protein ACPPVQ_12730 [Diaminobutyricibacter sp. McL0618]|uniref:hypothetical protein n=1 Tax=Leifsonia sp. McL0618 TaxID=3415677 RepID=UPI003CF9A672